MRLSPDGRRLAVIDHPIVGHDTGTLLLYEGEGPPRTLGRTWTSLQGLAWPPSSDEVWVTGSRMGTDNALFAVDTVSGRERELLSGGGRLSLHDIGPDGRVLLERSTSRMHMFFGRAGEPERDLTFLDGTYPVDLSDDGRLLLFGESGQAGGASQTTYVQATDGSSPIRLGAGRPLGFVAGATAALVAPSARPDHLEIVPLDAPEAARRYQAPGISLYQWASGFPGDSGHLLFVGAADRHAARTYRAALDGTAPVPLTPENVVIWRNTLSPDGRQLAARCPGRGYCLYGSEGEFHPIPGLGRGMPLRWDAAGLRLYAFEREGTAARVFSLDPRDGKRETLFSVAPKDPVGVLRIGDLVLTPDGRAWAYVFLRRLSELFVVEGLPARPKPHRDL